MAARKGTLQIGRDAKTGRFIPVGVARKRPSTAVVETIKRQSGTEQTKTVLLLVYQRMRR